MSGTRSPAGRRIGLWSAILTTAWIVLFDIAIALGAAGAPTRSVAVGASLLLALTFVALMAAVHDQAPAAKRIWSRIGLSFAVVYAALLSWNYALQLTVVRHDPGGYAWLAMDFAPGSAFWALESVGYTLMSLAALFSLPALGAGGLERAIRWCFGVNAVACAAGFAGYVATGDPLHAAVIASLGVWAIAFPAATALLAVIFKRAA
ncbi:MAG: hypothetical protein JW819_04735 [Candidatus Krumholzibacteriota bacterium]|nr:hypothetical protein [Candidatus Krumholzibacteriota bacterium]